MRTIATMALLTLAGATMAGAQEDLDRYERYPQSPAVSARYGDVPIWLDTPALVPGRDDFSSQEQMTAFLATAAARRPQLAIGSLGRSQQGRNIPYVVATAEGLTSFSDIRALGRPVVWLIGLQHGNEPAGGEGALAIVSALGNELAPLLDRVTVVVVP